MSMINRFPNNEDRKDLLNRLEPCKHNGLEVEGSSGQTYCAICLTMKRKKPPNDPK